MLYVAETDHGGVQNLRTEEKNVRIFIAGMTCGNCQKRVGDRLQSASGDRGCFLRPTFFSPFPEDT